MPTGFHDITIWQILYRENTAAAELIDALQELSHAEAAYREVFAGPLLRQLQHPHPRVRELALIGLCRNLGPKAIHPLHPLLSDPEPAVRAAAVAAWLPAIHDDRSQLAIPLFSEHADVRSAALNCSLKWQSWPTYLCLHAASDPELRPFIEKKLLEAEVTAADFELACRLYAHGHLSPEILNHLFTNLKDFEVKALWNSFTRAASAAPEAGLSAVPALRALLQLAFDAHERDAYKRLVDLSCGDGIIDPASHHLRKLTCEWLWHACASAGNFPVETIWFLAQLQPQTLTNRAIPAAIRAAAIDQLLRTNALCNGLNYESLMPIIEAIVAEDRSTSGVGIILRVSERLRLARLMKLLCLCDLSGSGMGFRNLFAQWFGMSAILDAMLDDPEAAAAFLAGEPHNPLDTHQQRDEWIQVVLDAHPYNLPVMLAGLLQQMGKERPSALMAFLQSPRAILPVARALNERLPDCDSVAAMNGYALAQQWAQALCQKPVGPVLNQLGGAGLLHDQPFAITLLRAVANTLMPDHWLPQFTDPAVPLQPDYLQALLRMIDNDGEFPFSAERQLFELLNKTHATPADTTIRDWLAARSNFFSTKTVAAPKPDKKPQSLLTLARRHYGDESATIEFGNQLLAQGRPLEDVLREASANPELRDRVDIWATVERLHAFWLNRPPEAKATYQALHTHRFADALLVGLKDPVTALSAAKIFRFVHWFLFKPDFLAFAQPKVQLLLPSLADNVREVLAPWVSSAGLPSATVGLATRDVPDWVSAFSIKSSKDIPQLLKICRLNVEHLVVRARKRLLQLRNPGLVAMAGLFEEDPVPPGVRFIAETFPHWPAGPIVDAVRSRLLANPYPPQVQFLLARALLEHSEFGFLPALIFAIASGEDPYTITPEDWERVAKCGVDRRQLAIAAVESPHPVVYADCVRFLLDDPPSPANSAALLAFLHCGTLRQQSLRIEVSHRLWQEGHREVTPILLAAWREQLNRRLALEIDMRQWLTECFATCGAAVISDLISGVVRSKSFDAAKAIRHILDALSKAKREVPVLDQVTRDCLPIIDHADLREALLKLNRNHGHAQPAFLRPLATLVMAGHDDALRLLGRRFEIELIYESERLGFTRMDEDIVHVNPLPLLHGEPHGGEIVHALILHELGHHRYHRSKAADAVAKQARQENLFGLLNLVLDEHLERNLRALDERYGNRLKLLAAYAFQHSRRNVKVDDLLRALGIDAYATLLGCRLAPAHDKGMIHVHNGQLLAAASEHQPFARFMRALRMGLGNRDGHPNVTRALKLFQGKAFRNASMQRLLEIARELRTIFSEGGENPESMCGAGGQDGLFGGAAGETERALEGIDNDALRAEIQRIRDAVTRIKSAPARSKVEDSDKSRLGALFNVGEDTTFARIQRIVPLHHDAEDYRELAAPIRFEARRLREFFALLGVRPRYDGGRASGRLVDRQRLLALVARNEPRVLRARILERKTGLHLGVLVDCSGSMSSADNIEKAKAFAALIAEATRGLSGIESRFWGFTDEKIYDAGSANRCAAAALEAGGGNNDAAALWHASRVALASRHATRLLVMISDGMPTECSVAALRLLVNQLTRNYGICCLQVAVHPIEEVAFPHYVELDTSRSLAASVRAFGELIVQRASSLTR